MKKEHIKKLGICLLIAGLFAAHVAIRTLSPAKPAAASWAKNEVACANCRIAFPANPELTQQAIAVSEEGPHLTYDIYQAPFEDGSMGLLLVATYPNPVPAGQELTGIEGLLNGIVSYNEDNKLIYAHLTQVGKRNAVEFLIESSSSYFRGMTLLVGNKLYLIAIEGREGTLDEQLFEQFAKSFTLTE